VSRLSFDDVITALDALGCQPTSHGDNGTVYARCPLPEHADLRPSTSWDEDGKGGVLGYCHRCSPLLGRDWYRRAIATLREALDTPQAAEQIRKAKAAGSSARQRVKVRPWGPAEAKYVYLDPSTGRPIAQKVRYRVTDEDGTPGRTFIWYRPLPRTDDPEQFTWLAKLLPDTELPLYRADVIAWARENRQPIFVPEGERDVETLIAHGYAAVCAPHGVDYWPDRYADDLAGLAVTVIADADIPGRRFAHQEARSLLGKAASVAAFEPPPPHKDVSDLYAAGGDLRALVGLAPEPEGVAEPEPADLLADLRDGAWLSEQVFPPLSYAVDRIIPEGYSLLGGAPKVGKSFLVLAFAVALAGGGVTLSDYGEGARGVAVSRRPVLYLALEDGERRLQDRCRSVLGVAASIPARFQFLTRVAPADVLVTIAAWLDRHPDGVVFLDTLGKVMPAARSGETTYDRDYRIGSALKRLADDHPGSAIVVNHHTRKAEADDFIDMVSGTHGLAGAADTVIILVRPRLSPNGTLRVTGRDVLEAEYALTFRAGRWALDGDTLDDAAGRAAEQRATRGVGELMADVITFVGEQTKDGGKVTPTEVADALDMDNDVAGKLLRRAAKAGRLRKQGRGQYGSPFGHSDTSARGVAGKTAFRRLPSTFLHPLPPTEVSECPKPRTSRNR
jgi:AAA domain